MIIKPYTFDYSTTDSENNPRDLWIEAEGTEIFLVFEGLKKLDFYSLSETDQELIREKLDRHFFMIDATDHWAKDEDHK